MASNHNHRHFALLTKLMKAVIADGATGCAFTVTGGANAGTYTLTPTGEPLHPYAQLSETLQVHSEGIGNTAGVPGLP